MSWIAAAVIGGAVIGAGASIYSSNKAADAQEAAAQSAGNTQLQMYYQSRADQAPWLQAGGNAVSYLSKLIEAGPGGTVVRASTLPGYQAPGTTTPTTATPATTAPIGQPAPWWEYAPTEPRNSTDQELINYYTNLAREDWLQKNGLQPGMQFTTSGTPVSGTVAQGTAAPGTPGGDEWVAQRSTAPYGGYQQSPYYNFLLSQGTQALERGAAARGGQLSGAEQKALEGYGQNIANMDYQNWLNQWYQSLTPYQSLAGLGQTAATTIGNQGVATGRGVGESQIYGGQAQAAGYLGMGNTIGNLANTGVQNYLNYTYANQMQNPYMGYQQWNPYTASAPGYSTMGQGAGGFSPYEWAAMYG